MNRLFMFLSRKIFGGVVEEGVGPASDALLLETGDFILLETSDFFLLE